jgi:hypothetical protein
LILLKQVLRGSMQVSKMSQKFQPPNNTRGLFT